MRGHRKGDTNRESVREVQGPPRCHYERKEVTCIKGNKVTKYCYTACENTQQYKIVVSTLNF